MAERMLTVREVADQLRVSPETVRRWLRDGKLRGLWISDRGGWRIPASELARFIQERSERRPGSPE
ncbi:MAG: helix-turn-helix domain-containing protein [Thermorudis peleae]|nr:helix-turn-helix domain-containing protein [Thermorudis peleae]